VNSARIGRRLAAVLFGLVLIAAACGAQATSSGTVVLKTTTGDHNFNVEVMTTNQERALGLMFRRQLSENAGMLFLYDRPQPAAMWMKNTIIPLDMIFIAAGGKVHRIVSHTVPHSTESISSDGDVVAVLELNAGQADKIGLRLGDKVVHPGLATD
jgi:uncharacterized membrane protein (UPF0127 family)